MIDLKEFVSRLNISEELSNVFMEMGEIVNLKRKEYFVRQGEPCRYLGAVLDGEFRFCHCDADDRLQYQRLCNRILCLIESYPSQILHTGNL